MSTFSSKHPPQPRSRRPIRCLAVAVLGLLAVLVVAACGSSSSSSSSSSASSSAPAASSSSASSSSAGALTLGTKNFTEEFIVGQLYKQALTAKGCKINYKENIGATEIVDKALTSGQIDAYPEYTGESVATVAKINTPVTSAQQEYNLAKQFYAKRGQVMSDMTPFFDTDAIAVTKAYAKQHGLVTTADLKKVSHFTLGARPEFLNRQAGALGMKNVYGVKNFSFKSLALGLQYQALDSGAVQAIDVFTTDPQLATGKYVVLKDPKNIFGFENIALVVDKNKVNVCPSLMTTVNAINKLLTTPAILAMNKAVAIDHQQPATVAAAFLKANHLS
jgi:osmoprotectant transport system substrate-binding protein